MKNWYKSYVRIKILSLSLPLSWKFGGVHAEGNLGSSFVFNLG